MRAGEDGGSTPRQETNNELASDRPRLSPRVEYGALLAGRSIMHLRKTVSQHLPSSLHSRAVSTSSADQVVLRRVLIRLRKLECVLGAAPDQLSTGGSSMIGVVGLGPDAEQEAIFWLGNGGEAMAGSSITVLLVEMRTGSGPAGYRMHPRVDVPTVHLSTVAQIGTVGAAALHTLDIDGHFAVGRCPR